MAVPGAQARITESVLAWDGVAAQPHRFGGTEYVIGRREIGHIHGDRWLDIPFPRRVRDELLAAGLAEPHHLLPESGWITFRLWAEADVAAAVDLLRRSYDLAVRQRGG